MNLTKSFVNNISDALFIVDSNHKVVYANAAVKDIIGKEPGEIINCYCYNIFTSDLCFKGCPFNYVTESRTSFTKVGVKVYDDNNNVKEITYTAFPYRDEMIDGIAVTLRNADLPVHVIEPFPKDYEHLPHKRQFYNELLQEVSDGVVMVDKSFKIIEFNKVAEAITGFKKEDVYGQPCPNICSFTEEFSCPFDYCLKTKHDVEEALTTIIRKTGEPIVVKVKLKILKDDSGNLLGGIALLKNIVTFSKPAKNDKCFMGICGKSDAIKYVLEFMKAVSLTKSPLLITGENGVGKDLVATTIHKLSMNEAEPFIKINCAAFPENLIEGELFGYENGHSLSNVSKREGKLELAGKGTVLLSEITETSLTFQAKLLRLIENGTFQALGSNEVRTNQARLILTSSKDLKAEIKKGNFREDLFYRLNTFHLNIPPLRERVEDIPLLAEHFLQELINSYGEKFSKKVVGFSDTAMEVLTCYDWKGNVRELKNVIENAYFMLHDNKSHITPEDLPYELREAAHKNNHLKNHNAEREKIINALRECDLDKTKASKLLGYSRVTLWRKIIYYAIKPEEIIR